MDNRDYIKEVILSCKTVEHLMSARQWLLNLVNSHRINEADFQILTSVYGTKLAYLITQTLKGKA